MRDPEFKRANEAIITSIAAANSRDSSAQHVFDDGRYLGWQLAAADVAITDISAMVYDRLATGKPIIIKRPASANAEIDESGYLGAAEWLLPAESSDIVAIADRFQHDVEARRRLEFWVERHFGDTTPGEATRRFHAGVEQLLAAWETHAAIHAADKRTRESDPFEGDSEDD